MERNGRVGGIFERKSKLFCIYISAIVFSTLFFPSDPSQRRHLPKYPSLYVVGYDYSSHEGTALREAPLKQLSCHDFGFISCWYNRRGLCGDESNLGRLLVRLARCVVARDSCKLAVRVSDWFGISTLGERMTTKCSNYGDKGKYVSLF